MDVYLDTSVLVSLFTIDALTGRAREFIRTNRPAAVVSDLAATEFSSVIARLTRMGTMDIDAARAVLNEFDIWMERRARLMRIETSDFRLATTFLRRLDLTLLAPDAIHLAIAQRLGATLATFDRRMAISATALGVAVAET